MRPSGNHCVLLHVASESSGDWRPCGGYRAIHTVTASYAYWITREQDLISAFSDCRVFSRIYLARFDNQIPYRRPKAAATTLPEVFELTWTSFGLGNVVQTLEIFMCEVTRGYENGHVYLDDALVGSHLQEQNFVDLGSPFDGLRKRGLKTIVSEFYLGKSSITLLELIISSSGIAPLSAKVTDAGNYPEPHSYR